MRKGFKIPPVSMLLGSTVGNYFKILKGQKISPEYRFKTFLTGLIVFISTPFHWWEELVYNKKRLKKINFKKPPVFILGHWRSGTTMLHNMLCSTPTSSYTTTYQTVFPNNLASKLIFKTFMKVAMPNRRPADNMPLDVSMPQEDEFALSNMYFNNYYNFFYFPENYREYYKKSILQDELTDEEKEEWLYFYEKLLKKAYINIKGERLIVKNPANTARIKILLKKYPDAKFLYIYRNPVTVYLSTKNFFNVVVKTLMLHKVSEEFISQMIFDVYKQLMDDYLEQKSLIPAENLYELKYEEFEKVPVEKMKDIYESLIKEDFNTVKDYFSDYFKSLSKHKKQSYKIDKSELDMIVKNLKKYMDIYGYDIPKDIKIKS